MINIHSKLNQAFTQSYARNQVQNEAAKPTTDSSKSGEAAATDASKDTETVQSAAKQDPKTTANNILDFVVRGIDQLKKSGASEERIQARLDAARAGIEKGYAEATQMLDDMGMLDEQTLTDISASRSLVDDSLTDLGSLESYVSNRKADQAAALQASQQTRQSLLAGFQSTSSRSAATSNQMSLEVKTRDGDTVTVYFESNAAAAESWSGGRYAFASSLDQQFSFAVDGELDDGEMEALGNLFKQVESLSNQFFAGDLGGALEQAMSMGYDKNELAAFSLDLRQSAFAQTSNRYQAVAADAPTSQLQGMKAQLANYADTYLATLQKANPFADAMQLLDQLTQSLVGKDNPLMPTFEQFNHGLRDVMTTRTGTAS